MSPPVQIASSLEEQLSQSSGEDLVAAVLSLRVPGGREAKPGRAREVANVLISTVTKDVGEAKTVTVLENSRTMNVVAAPAVIREMLRHGEWVTAATSGRRRASLL